MTTETKIDLPALHQRLLTLKRDEFASTDEQHNLFDVIVCYRNNLDRPEHLVDLINVCKRRIVSGRLSLDLIGRYFDLIDVTGWQLAQGATPKEPPRGK